MSSVTERSRRRFLRHRRIRKKIVGNAQRPRLCVFRSHKNIYVQLVDDFGGRTLLGCSTLNPALRTSPAVRGGTLEAAGTLGKFVAAEAAKAGIKRVVFDRGGYLYHGRVKALAEALRAGGLEV